MKTFAVIRVLLFWLVFPTLIITLVFACSRNTPKPTADPLAGWSIDFGHEPDPSIQKDYQDYIQKLPPQERGFAIVGQYFKDGNGQHAILIQVALNGTDWSHVLIYDKEGKRIKVVKYVGGHYRS